MQAPLDMKTRELPRLLEISHWLRVIDRFLSGLEEIVMFASSARRLLLVQYDQSKSYGNPRTTAYAELEVRKAVDKVAYGQRLCRSHVEHTRELVQTVSSSVLT